GWSRRSACASASARTEAHTCAPARASASTQARPIPLEAPVTRYDRGLMAIKYDCARTFAHTVAMRCAVSELRCANGTTWRLLCTCGFWFSVARRGLATTSRRLQWGAGTT